MSARPNIPATDSLSEVISHGTQPREEGKESTELKAELILEIADVAWFLLKNDKRKQLYFGSLKIITHPTNPDYLVFVFESPQQNFKKFTYVLSKELFVMKIFERNYVFASRNDDFYGMILDLNTSEEAILSLETIIEHYSHLKVKMGENRCSLLQRYVENSELYCGPPDQIALAGLKLAEYIRLGTVKLVTGIRFASEKSTVGLKAGSDKIKERIVPNEEPLKVSSTTRYNINKAKLAGKAAAKVSSALVTGAMAAANALSTELSSTIANTEMGQKISAVENPKMKAAKEVVRSTVAGALTVFDETVNAGLKVVKDASTATADIVGHKYGLEAHEAAKGVGDIVTDTATAAVNVNQLGVKALAKRVVATTTVDVLSTEEERKENRMSRVQIDPITGMQALMVASQLDQISSKNNDDVRNKRQAYIGLNQNGSNINNDNMNNNHYKNANKYDDIAVD